MKQTTKKTRQPLEIARHLVEVRTARGLSQAELAQRAGLQRQQITFYETGARTPSVANLLQMARSLDISLQRLLSGRDRPGDGVRDLAIELRSLGLIDLWVEAPLVPGAFRRPEEVVALVLAGNSPEARIVEGLPAVLAWNRWQSLFLWAHSRAFGKRCVYRLTWLADVVLALDRLGGFPGGCPGKEDLTAFLKRVKKLPSGPWDDLGRPAQEPPTSPVWKRWRINYAGDLATFRQRAEAILALAGAERRRLPTEKS
jgi:transcriptional regulator with XRE-family HTH domain